MGISSEFLETQTTFGMVFYHGLYWDKKMLVGGIPTPLKNMSSSIGTILPN